MTPAFQGIRTQTLFLIETMQTTAKVQAVSVFEFPNDDPHYPGIVQVRTKRVDGSRSAGIGKGQLWFKIEAHEPIKVDRVVLAGVAARRANDSLTSRTEVQIQLNFSVLTLSAEAKARILSLKKSENCRLTVQS